MSEHERDANDKSEEEACEADRILALFRQHFDLSADSPAYTDPRFLDWLAQDARQAADGGERDREVWGAEAIQSAARELKASIEAGRSPVACERGWPTTRGADTSGAIAQTLDEAADQRCAPRLELAPAAGVGRDLWDEECETWVELPDRIPDGRYIALNVAGDSMAPLLHAGDVMLVQIGGAATTGAIVVARLPDDGYVVKRVGRLQGTSIELLSLNPAFAPMRIPYASNVILGTVILRWCGHTTDALGRVVRG